ncbi:L,D-transpeptidase [bacterium endosymbiont of Pedicinus badii]|nr:L,D-transpeptidase [bacterium endosymbiont of Pedicinus badii]
MKETIKIFIYVFSILYFTNSFFSKEYDLPNKNGRLVGKNIIFTIPENNKLPLEYFAKKFQVGISNLLEANPKVDVYLPKQREKIIIPHSLILPDTIQKGIIINLAEMRLYYYPENTKKVIVFPIGIGQIGSDTPSNWITYIIKKKKNPSWIPSASIKSEYKKLGIELPIVFPPGPKNPMGPYALYIGNSYAIHGTNANFGIGLRVSHGCVRLRNSDIEYLYNHVPKKTRVEIINKPIKFSIEQNKKYYIEVHDPLSNSKEQLFSNDKNPIEISKEEKKILSSKYIDQIKLKNALEKRQGIPIDITK